MNHSMQHYDIIIIGGGFAGCALAYQFSKAKLKTLLLEQNTICSGTSAACAGRAQIIESETEEYLRIVREGFLKIPSLNDELDVDLEWELPGHLTLINTEENYKSMQKKVSLLKSHGIYAEMLDMQSLQKLEPNLCLVNILAAVNSAEGHINPFRFCFGFLNAARRNNAKIETHQKVIKFSTSQQKITAVHTTEKIYSGDTIILASGAWTNQITSLLGIEIPIFFTKAEALVSESLPKMISHHIGTSGFYESVHGKNRTVTFGIGQHRNGCLLISNAISPANQIDRSSSEWGLPSISDLFQKYFPTVPPFNILRTWSAPSPFAKDYLPVIGWIPSISNLYLAAAFHLAIPTIPLFTERIVDHILSPDDQSVNQFLAPFSAARFFNQDKIKSS